MLLSCCFLWLSWLGAPRNHSCRAAAGDTSGGRLDAVAPPAKNARGALIARSHPPQTELIVDPLVSRHCRHHTQSIAITATSKGSLFVNQKRSYECDLICMRS